VAALFLFKAAANFLLFKKKLLRAAFDVTTQETTVGFFLLNQLQTFLLLKKTKK
jgi:hypothetical protein